MPDRIDLNDLEKFVKEKNREQNDVQILASTDNIKLLTRLSKAEILIVSKLYYLVEVLEIDEIETMLDNLIQFKVSEGGKGRKEIVDVLKGMKQGQGFNLFGGGNNGFNR